MMMSKHAYETVTIAAVMIHDAKCNKSVNYALRFETQVQTRTPTMDLVMRGVQAQRQQRERLSPDTLG